MRTAAVLPVKSYARAKQRLGDAIGERRELAAAMVADVLDALAAVQEIDDVVVVTAEPLAARAAEEAGAHVVEDPEEAGQSAAAARGIDAALVRGAVLKGPTDAFLAWAGHPLSSEGIAAHYAGLIDGLVADERAESVPTLVTDVELGDQDARLRVAREVLAFSSALAG